METNAKLFLIWTKFLLILFLVPSDLQTVKLCFGDDQTSGSTVKCVEAEREALLSFKKYLTDPSGRLSSWVGEECCKWEGIQCNSQTGHVTKLNLRNPFKLDNSDGSGDPALAYKRSCLGGKLNPSLLDLKYLDYFDLSMNNFDGTQIPDFLGGLTNLRYLNLSFSSFSGEVPNSLGNLSRLQFLDLFSDSYLGVGTGELRAENLDWLSGLSSLRHLNMGHVKLNGVGETWLEKVNLLPLLVELNLHWCQLQGLPASLTVINFTSLEVLDLSENSFGSSIPQWLFNLTSLRKLYLTWNFFQGPIPREITNLKLLEDLDLSSNLDLEGHIPGFLGELTMLKRLDLSANRFTGEIGEFLGGFSSSSSNRLESLYLSSNSLVGVLPESLGRLKNLKHLMLSGNSFSGSLPTSIGDLSSLRVLDLSYNKMNGTIPKSFGQLSKLVDVNFLMNSWVGVLTESHLINLKSLESLRITTDSAKSLVFNVPYEWLPPFRLDYIQLENCRVGPAFPMWLQVQSILTFVTLKNAGISDAIPGQWFSALSARVLRLALSKNQIKGKLPSHLVFPKLQTIDLSSNRFTGPLPSWSTNATEVFLEDNSFSGPVPQNIAQLMPRLEKLFLSWNNLSGGIPSSLCDLDSLRVLSLRSNKLSGELPDCWKNPYSFWGFDASDNELSGVIPSSMGLLRTLSVLMLGNNNLRGEIPSSLQNCSGLTTIDLSRNEFTGSIPSWLQGKVVNSLFMLRLASNKFSGHVPSELCDLPNLHVLDLSENSLSGTIPKCLHNLSALVSKKSSQVFQDLLYVVLRGKEPEYSSIVANVDTINLSGNNLVGEIPDQITRISGLYRLNLSSNQITGRIPNNIGNLERLETLDLSRNRLSGPIPQSMTGLVVLKHLNLSYNMLEGKIPRLPQFDDASIFEGNPLLCGAPLPTKCKST